jgi:hypothetical protein
MYRLDEELFEKIKYDLEVLISFCSDPSRTLISTAELLDISLDIYSSFIKIKNEH